MGWIGAAWFALVEVAVVSGFVLYEAGVAAIPGVVIILLTQPLQVSHIIFLLFFLFFLGHL